MKHLFKNDSLYISVRNLIIEGQKNVVRSINTVMLATYFEVGKTIVLDEQKGKSKAGYARKTLKALSEKLTKEFGKGFSHRNLEYFRKFYLTYSDRISQTPSAKLTGLAKTETSQNTGTSSMAAFSDKFGLSWSHYILLMKISDKEEQSFYEIESVKNNWSVRELQRQFDSSLFERLALSRNKKSIRDLSKKGQIIEKPIDTLKNPVVLEFLGLKEDTSYTETDLENAIINKLEHFMMELGKGFLFEARQKRLSFEGDMFYVDLVFYNRLLRCYVLLDLKIGKLTHQDLGQMQMYVNYYDRKMKLPEENATIGIVLCKEENKAVIEFTLPENNKSIFAREYKLYLPSKEKLKKLLE